MEGLSNHTLLINKMIGLATNTYGWPSTLKNLGFKVETIEPRFVNSEGKTVNPDILYTSNRLLHALIAECKSGNTLNEHGEKQLKKYTKTSPESIMRKVSVHDPARLRLDICYSVGHENKGIIKEINEIKPFPVLIFSESNITKENHFSNTQLENAFSASINIDSKPPTNFYPFSDQDDQSIIALSIFQELMSRTLKNKYRGELEVEIDELLKVIHPLWGIIGREEKTKIKNKANRIISHYKRRNLREYLQKIEGKKAWKITKSLQAFGKECNKIIDDLDTQKTVDDTRFEKRI
ncbi:MAG: hypothetical protein L6408_01880 [Nanoarchaeota archaeon]|nr:hypothetical protein [Nanoarchaeota archaeon]